jgi:hypothetical protein
MIRFTKHAQEAISIRDIAVDWIERRSARRIGSSPIHATPTARDPIRQSQNMAPAFCGLCLDQRAMIS